MRVRLRGVYLRPLTMWRGIELDRQLAAGVPPQTSPLLAVRAAAITRPRSRRRVADGLARALGSAQETRVAFTAAVRPRASDLLAAGTVLTVLTRRLRSSDPVGARGVALLRTLLIDGGSPLYRPTEPGTLASLLRAAAAAMAASDPPRVA